MNCSLKWVEVARVSKVAYIARTFSCRPYLPPTFVSRTLLCAALWGSLVGLVFAQPSTCGPLEPGPIAITVDDTPAGFSFDPAQGRIETVGEGAAAATRAVLNTPNLGHAWVTAGAGVVQFALAPVAAGYGALRSSRERLSPETLAETEKELAGFMRALAGPEQLRDSLMQTSNQIGRPLVLDERTPSARCAARLEARLEQVRLERADRHDRFALLLTVGVRLSRTSDGALLLERQYQFRSGKALFVDWAAPEALASVARTGYRDLAEQIAKDTGIHSRAQPLCLGPGFSRKAKPTPVYDAPPELEPDGQQIALVCFEQTRFPGSAAVLPARLTQTGVARGLRLVSSGSAPAALHNSDSATADPAPTVDDYPDSLSFEVRSSGKTGLLLQLPRTKSEAVLEAQSDTEWQLDGLENDRNFVVQAAAALASLPLGIREQSVAIWNGLSRRRLSSARASLEAVAGNAHPQKALALEVARSLTVPAMEQFLPALAVGSGGNTGLTRCSFSAETVSLTRQDLSDTVLQIRVLRGGLSGPEGVNPRLSLNVEAHASVIRTVDGLEICSIPVCYRSRPKRFGVWAAQDARALREELAACYRQMGGAMALEIAARGLALPGQTSIFASK